MRIKKFTGTTLQDATGQMKAELGAEAIILNTRKVSRGGALNFLGHEMFEITAAVDDPVQPATNSYAFVGGASPIHAQQGSTPKKAPRVPSRGNTFEGLAQVAQHFEKRAQQNGVATHARSKTHDAGDIEMLKSEMEDVKTTLKEIAGHLKYTNMPALPDALKLAYSTLIEQDVDPRLASDLVQSVYLKLGEDAIGAKGSVEERMIERIASLFTTVEPVRSGRKRTRVVALVGPTGVGKTTTIAKLAAQSKLNDGLSVALISADTYRIGAIEQLHTFAAIADIPMEVVYKPSEMEQALRKFRDKDIVYVDTVGRSLYKKKEVAEVAKFVSAADADEVHLVLSASTQMRTMLESVEKFAVVKANRFVITKTDEAASFGSLLSLAKNHQVPISFVTNGQGVPDDIVAARPADLALMVYKGVLPHA